MPQLQKGSDRDKGDNLKGTLASVLILGGFLVVSWLVVFLIFLARNGG